LGTFEKMVFEQKFERTLVFLGNLKEIRFLCGNLKETEVFGGKLDF
jgi:hypothetical protein